MKLSLQSKWFLGLLAILAGLLVVLNLGLALFLSPYLLAHDVERETVAMTRQIIFSATLATLAAGVPLALWAARRISEPVEQMRQMVTRVVAGDFSVNAPTGEGELGGALQKMAQSMETRLHDLAAEKAELNATLSNMIEGVLVVDATGRIRLANRTLQRQFNVSELIVGKTTMEAFRNAALQDIITQALTTGPVSQREMTFFGTEERVFDINTARLLGHDNRCIGAVVVFHDITRIKNLENIRKDFVANVSHELRTPLAIIKGYVETLLDEPPPDERVSRQFLQIIAKHSARLEALIEDLLSISALESQQVRLDFTTVSLREIAEAVAEELARQAKERDVTIAVEIPDNLPPARADAKRLHQVFFNLVENAIKYNRPGGRVIISAALNGSEIVPCIADTGPGIAAEHLPHIFERFYRVDKARSRDLGGTGLGLSIVKHIVQAHGGKVWVESQLEKGSQFYFTVKQ